MSEGATWQGRRIHLVGVGGAGMSAYARAARSLGAQVSGSDAAGGPYLEALAADGVLEPALGHRAENLPEGEGVELFYSSAIGPENVERAEARRRGVPELPRAELLGRLSALRRTIAVAGTHGKTTTASMIVHALRALGLEPGWLVGAPIGGGLGNACWSESEWLVVEADESDRSMLSLHVEIALVTNVELDHHANFASLEELRETFATLLDGAARALVWDRPELLSLSPRHAALWRYDIEEVELGAGSSRFRWRGREVALQVPGEHNALDALGALEAARLVCTPQDRTGRGDDAGEEPQLPGYPQAAIAALEAFTGAGRRFQAAGRSRGGALLYDDYAHHPTEIAATLAGARTLAPRRLVAVFQPHLHSRTRLLAREFGIALAAADVVAVLDVYAARERAEDFPGVSGLQVARAAADAAAGGQVLWLPAGAQAQTVLDGLLGEGDLCVLMGAGDIDGLTRALAEAGDER